MVSITLGYLLYANQQAAGFSIRSDSVFLATAIKCTVSACEILWIQVLMKNKMYKYKNMKKLGDHKNLRQGHLSSNSLSRLAVFRGGRGMAKHKALASILKYCGLNGQLRKFAPTPT